MLIVVAIIVDNDRGGAGTQDVGVVQVQDSNAGTNTAYYTFRARPLSVNKGHNVNWIFTPASGTVLLLR